MNNIVQIPTRKNLSHFYDNYLFTYHAIDPKDSVAVKSVNRMGNEYERLLRLVRIAEA